MGSSSSIPTYKLYGESTDWPTPELVHCETIAARSALHGWVIGPHRHADLFQLLYCRSGAAHFLLDGRKRLLPGPSLAAVPALCVHGFWFDPACQGWVLTLPEFALERFVAADEGLLETFRAPRAFACGEGARAQALDALFEQFAREFGAAQEGRLLALEAILGLVLVLVARAARSQRQDPAGSPVPGAARLRRFRELVERHFREWRPVSSYAAELGVTPAHLNNTCRRVCGQSALELVHDRVLLEAKRNLVYTSMTVSEAAYALGFSDPAYFTRFFKRRAGKTPSQFREARLGGG